MSRRNCELEPPKKNISCYICLNDINTWCCNCKEDGAERTAAIEAGLKDKAAAIRTERAQGRLLIRPGFEYD